MKNKPTVKDVAEAAGVAPSTVSYAFNGKRPISDEVKNRIMKAVDKLGYRSSYAASLMKSSCTMNIGVVIDQCSNPATGLFLNELGNVIRENKYNLILGVAGEHAEEGERVFASLTTGLVDGIINMHPAITIDHALKMASGVPIVTYCRPDERSPVCMDLQSGINEMLDYVFGLGHSRIGCMSLRKRSAGVHEFKDPCINAIRHYYKSEGLEFDEDLVVSADATFKGGMQQAEVLYKKGVSAIFAGNDISGAGVLAWALANGIRVPEDISVIGFDNSPQSATVYPLLTTIGYDQKVLAKGTFEGLKDVINGNKKWRHRSVATSLVIRNSCAEFKGREDR